jgi:hypothetical protein
MTWREWVESSYNTGGFIVDGNKITDPTTNKSVYNATVYVSPTDLVSIDKNT